jgi:hypothetical protein
MRIDMNIAALRNMIALVRNMIHVVRGNASRHLHSGSRTSRHQGSYTPSRRDDLSNPTGQLAINHVLQSPCWQWLTMVEGRLYLPAAIKPAAVTRASKTLTSSTFRTY